MEQHLRQIDDLIHSTPPFMRSLDEDYEKFWGHRRQADQAGLAEKLERGTLAVRATGRGRRSKLTPELLGELEDKGLSDARIAAKVGLSSAASVRNYRYRHRLRRRRKTKPGPQQVFWDV
jgi:hypothetical protein